MSLSVGRAEAPTLVLLVSCYGFWGLSLWAGPWGLFGVALTSALHSSLQHEAIHGHPTRHTWLNGLLVAPALGLLVPYLRFRETHLAHHVDARLTDPYDDPETNYLDPAVWRDLPRLSRTVLAANNTLLGRLLLGPAVATVTFALSERRAHRAGDPAPLRGWLWHIPAVLPVLALAWAAPIPVWAYLLGAYLGHSLLKIRTFAEHQAHLHAAARSVIIEDRGPLALLFLNNNLHVVHHMHPGVPWYDLPRLYWSNRDRYLARNQGYAFASYGALFRRYFLRRKDPVPHPLYPEGSPPVP